MAKIHFVISGLGVLVLCIVCGIAVTVWLYRRRPRNPEQESLLMRPIRRNNSSGSGLSNIDLDGLSDIDLDGLVNESFVNDTM